MDFYYFDVIKMDILEMLNELHDGELDLARLNFGVLALTTKINMATSIKEYKPICLPT
jgi:hypothetical protein